MKKRMIPCLCILLLAVLALPAFAQADGQRVFDGGAMLTAAEEQRIASVIADLESQTDCDFYFATYKLSAVDRVGGRSNLGESFLREKCLSNRDNIVILTVYLDFDTYYYNMFTYGSAMSNINDKEVDYILDHPAVYDHIKGSDLAGGAESFFALSAKAYRGRVGASYAIIGGISLMIGTTIGAISCFGVWKSYKRKKRPIDYPLDRYAKMELVEHDDVFTGSFVTRRVIQSSSGGGRSGGGGGGHRGGR